MADIPEKIPREAGNLSDGQSYERKLLLFVAASLSQNVQVDNFWIISNPTGIHKIDDVVARVSFKDSAKKDIAVFIQAKLISSDKLLWLKLNDNDKKSTQKCIEIKLAEYVKAFTDVIEMMSTNNSETEELRKLLKGVDVKDYFVCIFTNMQNVEPELQFKQFNGSDPIYFLDARRCGQYRQFDFENEHFNSNFYKQLYVFLGQPNFVDIDSSIAQLLGEGYKHRLENLDKIVKDFMQRNKLCWVLTKPAFEMNWFKVLVMDWMYINLDKNEEINPKFERLWQNILANQKIINLCEDTIWPLLAYYYQCVIIKEVDENFELQNGIKHSISQNYSENELRELLILLWRERKLPLAIKSDCTRHILKFLDQFKTVEGGFVVFSNEELPDVITHVKQISDVEVMEEAMKLEVSLQGRPPVALSDIADWQTFSELKIAQVLAWTNSLEDGRQHIVGPVLRIPDETYITRIFTRKEDKTQDQNHNDFSQYDQEIEENNDHLPKQQREILTVEDVVKLAGPKLHIITGDPGMGKSTVLEQLAHKYSSKKFVIYVILRDCLEDIECEDSFPSIEADPIQYFFNKMAGKSDDIISESIFESHKTNKLLCLFLDGFDEILPMHGKKLFSLIASILENTAIPIFCTTRPHGEEQITECPNAICLELSPFGNEQIRQYLNRRNIEAKNIEKLFDDNFLSNPLHLNMLSQIYENAGDDKEITRGKMYKTFIELKYTTYNEKIKLSQNYSQFQTEISLKHHRKLALVDLFGRDFVTSKGLIADTELDAIVNEICKNNIGIVDVSTTKGKFRFHHRTFAEYLVADWLVQMAKEDISKNNHFKYVYKKVMRDHRNIRSMINDLSRYSVVWSEASKRLHISSDIFTLDEFGRNVAHAAKSYKELDKLMKSVYRSRLLYRVDAVLQWTCRAFFNMKRNEIGYDVVDEINNDHPTRTPLAVSKWRSWKVQNRRSLSDRCKNLLAAIDSENKDDVKSILKSKQWLLETGLGIIAFHSAITTGNESIVRLLLDLRPMLLNEQDDNQNTALHIACAFGCRGIVALLLENDASLDIINKDTWSPLEMAAAEGQLEIVSLLLDYIRKRIDVDHDSTEHYSKLLYRRLVTIACANGRSDVVTWLIEQGADPTLLNDDGWAAMHCATQEGQLEILTLLLKRGLDVNAKTNKGWTPLYIAIQNNHLVSTKWLLEHSADPTISNNNGWAAIHFAARQGLLEILTLLLDKGLNVNEKTNKGSTPLYIAIQNNHLDTTKWLLDHGADPTVSNNDGWAAMHIAARLEHLEILALLLDRGLEVNAKTNKGSTPLYIAIQDNHPDTTKWLLDHGADPTISDENGLAAIHFASRKGQLQILTLLLESGVDVNAKTDKGFTPICIAILKDHLHIAKCLLEHHADPTLSDFNGWTPMHYATEKGHLEILTLLLERGVDVNAKTDKGFTPICIAIVKDHLDIAKCLLEHDADPSLSNDQGWTAMHFAAEKGQLEILALLLERMPYVNAKTNTGLTPLHAAIANNHLDNTKWLLGHGADATLSAENGWTALHFAARQGQLEILKLLLGRGLNINSKSKTGETALIISFDNEHWGNVKWLLEHGADHTVSRNDGWTSVHFAAKGGQLQLFIILVFIWGVNVYAKTNSGETPLSIASKYEHWHIVNWLQERTKRRSKPTRNHETEA